MNARLAILSISFLIYGLANAQPLPPAQVSSTTLTLPEAIRLAIQNNLSTKLAKAGTEQARGQAIQAASALLPQLTGQMAQSRTFKVNLEAQGFPATGLFNPLIGPYNTFDARFRLVQTILDLSSIYRYQAGKANRKVAELQERLSREQVAAAAALSYIEAQRTERAVAASQAELRLSESLLKLARDQKNAGVSTGVDVARAETRAAQENLRLIRARIDAQQADLRLKRVVGLPLDQPLALTDLPRDISAQLPTTEQAIPEALNARPEMQIVFQIQQAAEYAYRGAEAGHLPTIVASGDYGFSGNLPNNSARTGSIGGRLDLPIFSGGRAHGQVVQAQGQLDEAASRATDTKIQIEEDIRLALQTLEAAIEETKTADQAVALAKVELKMARDRFAAGVGDNIQVLAAQTTADRALDDQVNALAHYDQARANFATALGQMEQFH